MTGTERPGGEETRLPVAAAIVDDNDDALSRWRRLLRRVSLNNLFSFPLSLSLFESRDRNDRCGQGQIRFKIGKASNPSIIKQL